MNFFLGRKSRRFPRNLIVGFWGHYCNGNANNLCWLTASFLEVEASFIFKAIILLKVWSHRLLIQTIKAWGSGGEMCSWRIERKLLSKHQPSLTEGRWRFWKEYNCMMLVKNNAIMFATDIRNLFWWGDNFVVSILLLIHLHNNINSSCLALILCLSLSLPLFRKLLPTFGD